MALPRLHPDGNLSISPLIKTKVHFLLKIPQTRLESTFPHEKHGGFHMLRLYTHHNKFYSIIIYCIIKPFKIRHIADTCYSMISHFHILYLCKIYTWLTNRRHCLPNVEKRLRLHIASLPIIYYH